MMFQIRHSLIIVAIAVFAPVSFLSCSTQSGDSGVAKGKQSSSQTENSRKSNVGAEAIEVLLLADNLAAYGRKQHDALSLMLAARIMKDVHFRKPKAGNQGPDGRSMMRKKIHNVLSEAIKFALGRKDIQAMIEDVRLMSSKGRVDGPLAYYHGALPSNGETSLSFQFAGGENATVYSSGENEADIDLIVTDAHGTEICIGPVYTPRKKCSWVPRSTGRFNVSLGNDSEEPVEFTLVTN